MATLTVTQTEDYSDSNPSVANTDAIVFNTSADATATFSASQFGGANISNNVAISGDDNGNVIVVNVATSTAFSAAGWAFDTGFFLSQGDRIRLIGSAVGNTITGTANDVNLFIGGGGVDTLTGGNSIDRFEFSAGDLPAGETINGGGGSSDEMHFEPGAYNLLAANISGIEELNMAFVDGDVTITVSGDLMGASGIDLVRSIGSGTHTLNVNGSNVDLSAVNFVALDDFHLNINGTGGSGSTNTLIGVDDEAQTITGGGGTATDVMTGGVFADTLNGGGGDDTFNYLASNHATSGEVVDGGTGNDTLRLSHTGTIDFRTSTLTSIERLTFDPAFTPLPNFNTAIFSASQFGASGVTNNLAVTGDSSNFNTIRVVLAATGAFSAANWTFSNWSPTGDETEFIGTSGIDTITGSSQSNFFDGGGGADVLVGAAGNDAFLLRAGEVVAGEQIIGGAHVDRDQMTLLGTIDFSAVGLSGVELISLNANSVVFTGTQIGSGSIGGVVQVVGSSNSTQSMTVNGANVDLSGVSFTGWGGVNQSIIINGTAGADVLTGSSRNDTFNAGADADVINGGAGLDSAVFSGDRSAHALTNLGNGQVQVVGPDGVDIISSVEKLVFDDLTLNWPPGDGNDFNADAFGDVLFRNTSTGQVATWELNGVGGFGFDNYGAAGLVWQQIAANDFNADGKGDILFRNGNTGQVATWELNGSGGFSFDLYGAAGLVWQSLGAGDFNADGKGDVLFRNSNTGQVATWELNGAGGFAFDSYGVEAAAWKIAGVGDFNADGMDDILWRNSSTGQVKTWELNGAGGFAEDIYGAASLVWHIYGVGDFNADGRDDVLFRNNNGQVATWELNGAGGFSFDSYGAANAQWSIVDATDTNSDGRDDILWRNTSTGQVAAWELNGAGGFSFQGYGAANLNWQIFDGNFQFV